MMLYVTSLGKNELKVLILESFLVWHFFRLKHQFDHFELMYNTVNMNYFQLSNIS